MPLDSIPIAVVLILVVLPALANLSRRRHR